MTKKDRMPDKSKQEIPGERIAKVIARAGLASRREAEAWIAAGRVAVNGKAISSPALNVTAADRIAVDGAPLRSAERTRLFLYNKPRGLVTTHSDPQGRPTIFGGLPKNLPRLISIGRLDLNTEGLLLLTNDGGLARVLELPATAWLRRYRVRALGRVTPEALAGLRTGVTVDGVRYGPIEASLDREQGSNVWLTFAIREGKNREVRKVLESLGLKVNRLIRVSYGPFQLGELADGAVEEIKTQVLREQLGPTLAAQAGADFEAPVMDDDMRIKSLRHSGTGRRPEPGIQKQTRSSSLDSGSPLRGSRNDRKERQGRAPQDDGAKPVRLREKKKPGRDRRGGPRPSRPR